MKLSKKVKGPSFDPLFERVASILEQARTDVVRSVNSGMVLAYWLIGREIVQAVQGGKSRAEYGERIVSDLAARLTRAYGQGFSRTNLAYFKQFHLAFPDRQPEIVHTAGGQSLSLRKIHTAGGVLDGLAQALEKDGIRGFFPRLSWSHYRALMEVEDRRERNFYEREAAQDNWSVRHLRRQINTFLFARLLKSRDKAGLLRLSVQGQVMERPVDALKDPYILDFLNLPEDERLRENKLESAIVTNLQKFLLELGKGFAFVGRQQRVSTESKDFYIDLVFYNYLLKCFVLFDLKVGELTHQDVGQMDMYVRLFDDQKRAEGDNPTVGIILCAQKDASVVRYSVLHGNKRLFASKYKLVLPSEEELRRELERERLLLTEGTGKESLFGATSKESSVVQNETDQRKVKGKKALIRNSRISAGKRQLLQNVQQLSSTPRPVRKR